MKTAPAMQQPKKTTDVRGQFSIRDERRGRRTPEDGGCADVLAELVEGKRRNDGTGFTARGRHTVRGGLELRWEDLSGVDLQVIEVSGCEQQGRMGRPT